MSDLVVLDWFRFCIMRIKLIFLPAILSFIDFGAVIKKKKNLLVLSEKKMSFWDDKKDYVTSLTCL